MPKESIGFFDVLKQIEMKKWTKNRICLIGDACACLSPLAGQGASMAMLETFVLSNMLKNSGTIEEGLERFDSVLKSDIASRQAQARRLASRFVSPSVQEMAWTRWITRMEFSSLLVGRTAKGFIRKILKFRKRILSYGINILFRRFQESFQDIHFICSQLPKQPRFKNHS